MSDTPPSKPAPAANTAQAASTGSPAGAAKPSAAQPNSAKPETSAAQPVPGAAKPAPEAAKPASSRAVATKTSNDPIRSMEPVHADEPEVHEARWTGRLVIFLRVMAVLSMAKGLYHWSIVCGLGGPADGFEYQPTPWQTATVFFAVIDLVAAVGLWLAAAWGAVVWLTACVSMAAVEVFFPQVYGGRLLIVAAEGVLLFTYLGLAIQSAREHPN